MVPSAFFCGINCVKLSCGSVNLPPPLMCYNPLPILRFSSPQCGQQVPLQACSVRSEKAEHETSLMDYARATAPEDISQGLGRVFHRWLPCDLLLREGAELSPGDKIRGGAKESGRLLSTSPQLSTLPEGAAPGSHDLQRPTSLTV